VSTEDSRSKENLYDGFELHPPWTRDFLDPVSGNDDDAQVLQHSSKPAFKNWSFGPEGLHLVRTLIHILVLGVAWGRVLFISLVFYILVLYLLLLSR
jgi:hypothetical protein